METEPPARVRILRIRWAAALALATLVAVLAAPGSAHATGVPTIASVSPGEGPEAGGTSVTITGTNFTGATAVKFGSANAKSFKVNSETSITAKSPAGSGAVHVTVTAEGTSATSSADLFSYVPPPTVTEVSPKVGPTAGATTVTITGSNLSGATAVQFGSSPAMSFEVKSGTEIKAVSPAGTAGIIDIRVTTPGGTSATSTADQFSYISPPTVTEVSPNEGPWAGGTAVTITGSKLSGATAVQFGSSPAMSFEVKSETEIKAVSPAWTTTTVDIRVTTPGGTSEIVPADQFQYRLPPAVTEVSPKEGSTAGGTSVTITGINLASPSVVKFGEANASSVIINSTTSITAVAPPGTGTVHVTVTTAGGKSNEVPADQFSYVPPPSTPPSNPGTGQAAPPASTASTPSPPLPPTKVKLALIANVHERLIHGTTLEVSFRLTVKARVRMIARRGRKVVARTQFRTLAAGNHRLLLVLSRRRWPTKLELQSRALAPLLTISQ